VSPYKKAAVTPDSLARAFKVGTLVTGDVAQSGDRLRVSVSLINAATGAEIGSKTLERPRQEIFALQDDLAKEVAVFLRQRLGQEVELRKSRQQTRNPAAWELLQKAEQEISGVEPLVTAGDVTAATRQFTRADSLLAKVELADPKWVTPVTQRGWIAYRQARLSGSFDKADYAEQIQKGMGHVDKALKLQPGDPDALELRGTLTYLRWLLNLAPDPAEAAGLMIDAEKDLRAAVAANPEQASAWNTLSHLLINKLETAEAKLAALRAYDADPYLTNANLTIWRLFSTSLDLEDGVEARHWCGEGQRRFPADPRFAECQIWLFALKGETPDIPKAWSLLDEYLRLSPPNLRDYRRLRGQMLVAMALARAGLADSARAVAARSRADATMDPPRELVSFEAIVRTILGDKDEAIRLLGVYFATNPQQRSSIDRDESWWYQDLRGDPRYQALVGVSPKKR
jgi:tetratricopeptide (TPR) repeat protein